MCLFLMWWSLWLQGNCQPLAISLQKLPPCSESLRGCYFCALFGTLRVCYFLCAFCKFKGGLFFCAFFSTNFFRSRARGHLFVHISNQLQFANVQSLKSCFFETDCIVHIIKVSAAVKTTRRCVQERKRLNLFLPLIYGLESNCS